MQINITSFVSYMHICYYGNAVRCFHSFSFVKGQTSGFVIYLQFGALLLLSYMVILFYFFFFP